MREHGAPSLLCDAEIDRLRLAPRLTFGIKQIKPSVWRLEELRVYSPLSGELLFPPESLGVLPEGRKMPQEQAIRAILEWESETGDLMAAYVWHYLNDIRERVVYAAKAKSGSTQSGPR